MIKIYSTILLLFTINSYGQQLLAEKIYPFFAAISYGTSIDTTNEQGYIISLTQNINNFKFTNNLVKLDRNGDTIWTRKGNRTVSDRADFGHTKKVRSGYLSLCSAFDTNVVQVNKYKANGDLSFSKNYQINGRTGFDITSLVENTDNDFLLFGASWNTLTIPSASRIYSVLEFDSSGNEINQNTFIPNASSFNAYTSNMVKYAQGKFVMYGSYNGFSSPFIIKINTNLDTIATKMYHSVPGDEFDSNGNIIYTKSNHLVFSGQHNAQDPYYANRYLVMKSDTAFNTIWTTKIGKTSNFQLPQNILIELTNDSILLISNERISNKILLYKITGDGNVVDSSVLISNYTISYIKDAVLKKDGTLAICGYTYYNQAYWASISISNPVIGTCTGLNCSSVVTCIGINCTNCFGMVCTVPGPCDVPIPSCTCPGYTCPIPPCNPISFPDFSCQVWKDTLYVSDVSKGKVLLHQWEIGNTYINKIQNLKYKLTLDDKEKDTLLITLIVRDPDGCDDTLSKKISIKAIDVTGISERSEIIRNQLIATPNPATDESVISYILSDAKSDAAIEIYDLTSGKTIQYIRLSESDKTAQSLTLNVSNYASGVYSYRLWVNEKVADTKKLVVIK